MPAHNLTRKECQEAINAAAKHRSISDAARSIGMVRQTFCHRLETAKAMGLVPGVDPRVWEMPEPAKPVIQQSVTKLVVRIPAGSQASETPIRVLGIGDAHDDPRLDKDRFYWIGRYAAEHRIPRIESIGDWSTFDSLNSYDANDTFAGRLKPIFLSDMASLVESKEAFKEGLSAAEGYSPILHKCQGNHEDRMHSYENRHPENYGTFFSEYHRVMERFGWSYSPFGKFHFIGGVGFIHVPLNKLGKPYGGKHAANAIANDTLHDIVYGHDHKEQKKRVEKIGDNHYVVIGNLGCALPEGHVEPYAKHSATGWSYGIVDMEIYGGHIQSWNFIPMRRLQETYSKNLVAA